MSCLIASQEFVRAVEAWRNGSPRPASASVKSTVDKLRQELEEQQQESVRRLQREKEEAIQRLQVPEDTEYVQYSPGPLFCACALAMT